MEARRRLGVLWLAVGIAACGGKVVLETDHGSAAVGAGGAGAAGSSVTGSSAAGTGGSPPACAVACVSTHCDVVPLATGKHAAYLTLDESTVYFTAGWLHDGEKDEVIAVSKQGGAPLVLADWADNMHDVAHVGEQLYFATEDHVYRLGLQGGPGLGPFAVEWATGLTGHGDALYWGSSEGSMVRLENDGGFEVLATGQPDARWLAVDGASVYWTTATAVRRVPIAGGEPETLVDGLQDARGLAVDGENVYVVDRPASSAQEGRVLRVPKDGGDATLVGESQGIDNGVALDETSVYWLADGSLVKACKAPGGAVVELAPAGANAWAVAVDDQAIYWTGGDTVWRRPK